jgi:perosamine synthetase
MPNRIHSWHLYPVRLQTADQGPDRATVIAELKAAGISASVHWMPLHLHPYYRENLDYRPSHCPRATSIYPELLSLPLYPDLTPEEIEWVCFSLKKILASRHPVVAGLDLPITAEQKL